MAGKRSYKTLLLEARELRHEAGKNAHKRATLLVKVFDDRDFRDEVGAIDDFAAAECLNAEVEDLCLTFLQLREMLKAFPLEADWADGKLRTLYNRTLEIGKAAEEANRRDAVRTRRVVSLKELEQVEQQKNEAEAALRHQERKAAQFVTELDQLKAENQSLRMENAELKGRISELERIAMAAR